MITKPGTKERILDAAERLFAENGVAATSLRSIIAAAKVNLASVHYHFGSKDGLLEAIVHRLVDPINEERLEMLAELSRQYGDRPIPLRKLVDVFVSPMIRFASQSPRGEVFTRLLGRFMGEPDYFFGRIAPGQFAELRTQYLAAFRKTLPDLPPEEIFWRLMLGIGAAAHVMRIGAHMPQLSDGLCHRPTVDETVRRLESFLTAGLRAKHTEAHR